ncbi:PREDICTED: odorant receptor 63a-like [Vollenhovia emeryi]|uniref:odorant receptor 63a-like n=1 Tax=Vollenhovia emeryi TaxID=411798 RepID=UPI0005F53BE5|nr:PREDICTED: odorant receptor 63a-like [Vollenhovia emeryi]
MVFPEAKYYRYNHMLLSSIGLWPYDNSTIGQIQVVVSLLIFGLYVTIQFIRLLIPEFNLDFFLEVVALTFFILVWIVKYINLFVVIGSIKQIRKCVKNNWNILSDNREIDIMHKYADIGRQSTIAIMLVVYVGYVGFILIQFSPDLLDTVMPLNESRSRILLYQAKYSIVQEKYLYIIMIHESIGLFLCGTTGIAAETFLLVNALHAFGMFKVTRYRMERMLNEDVSQISIAKSYIIFHDKIMAAVDTHTRAIEFSELLKNSFGISYLFMILTALISATASLFRLFRIITMQGQEKIEILKLINYVCPILVLLVVGNFVGQEFTNNDDLVHRAICNTKWYNAPLKIQKFILFLLRKTTKSYKVDAGGLFSPSLEGLTTTMSLVLSVMTLLCSI